MPPTLRTTPRTGQGFIEPLLAVPDALPLHLVQIPGGTFTMGSPEEELEHQKHEGPQHSVTVPLFFMGRYPVTQAQYQALMGTNPATEYEADRFVAPNKPVVGVSWQDATEFCQRLSAQTGRTYRLPSEAEWEYACRAGTQTPFYFGKTLTTEVANYDGNYTYADGPKGEFRNGTIPVDLIGLANRFGLSDMHGNVWEWCEDDYHDSYEGAPEDGSAWVDAERSKILRILRGGAWDNDPWYCRSASRGSVNAEFRSSDVGFRLCCTAPRKQATAPSTP